MSAHHLPLIAVAGSFAIMVKKTVGTISDILLNLTYFGWRPSVVYLSGRRRKVGL